MQHGKSPGKDGIVADIFKDVHFHKGLEQLFTHYTRKRLLPKMFGLRIVTIHSKN